MKTLMLLVALLTAGPAWATSLTWNFTGNSVTYATITGSFTYDSEASPTGYNVRGRDPNVTYALTDWEMTVTNRFSEMGVELGIAQWVDLPGTFTFSNTLANNTAEFCVGECIFSQLQFEGLVFTNGLQTLQLEFLIPSVDPFWTAPPDTLADWGPLYGPSATTGGAAWFRSYDTNGTFQIMADVTAGSITGVTVGETVRTTPAVPEVPTGVLCLIGLAMVGWFTHKRRVS